jgi:uncharacterized protein (DUF4415 family)
MKKEYIARYSAEELDAMRQRGESRTDLERLDRMTEEELEAAISSDPDADIPDAVLVGAFENFEEVAAYFSRGDKPKRQVTLRLDEDVLDYFKRQGKGYQTRINAVLRAFVERQRKAKPRE